MKSVCRQVKSLSGEIRQSRMKCTAVHKSWQADFISHCSLSRSISLFAQASDFISGRIFIIDNICFRLGAAARPFLIFPANIVH
ncbi:MAG: hypothetical protein K0Q77_2832 [Anaerosporomusa subterranea]|jgi:hypothetical protein|nr:hypothetical protein [Anaerosporomusa subterranea]